MPKLSAPIVFCAFPIHIQQLLASIENAIGAEKLFSGNF